MQTIDYSALDVKTHNSANRTLKIVVLAVLGGVIMASIVVTVWGEDALPTGSYNFIIWPLITYYAVRKLLRNRDTIRKRLAAFAAANGWRYADSKVLIDGTLLAECQRDGFIPNKDGQIIIQGTVDEVPFSAAWLIGEPKVAGVPIKLNVYRTVVQVGDRATIVRKTAVCPTEIQQLFEQTGLIKAD